LGGRRHWPSYTRVIGWTWAAETVCVTRVNVIRARLFMPQEGEDIPLSGVLVPGRGHPLKGGHTPGDRSPDVCRRARGGDTPHGDDQQADGAVVEV
jgi:hypothetical protein